MNQHTKRQGIEKIYGSNLKCFMIKSFYTLNNAILHDNWHLDLVVKHLEAIELGELHKLIITIPP